jgi:phenylacetate-CoA ligase
MDYDQTEPRALSQREIEEVQSVRFRALIRRLWENSPFYHRRLKEAGIDPDSVKEVKDLSKVPFTTKDDLRREGYPYGGNFLAVPFREVVGWHMTSGTTGIPTVGAYTMLDVKIWTDLVARCLRTAGVTEEDVVANVYGYGLFTGGMGLHMGAQRLGAKVIPWGTGRTEALVKTLKDFRATVITGTPSYELLIAEKIKREGTKLNLRLAIPGAESMTPETLKRIEQELNLSEGAREIYGLTEAMGPGVAQECPEDQHRWMHVWTDHFVVEVVDPNSGEVLGEGEEGELVITTLSREAMPLLRFRTRDITKLGEPDHIPYPRLSIMKGRVDDVIFYKGVKVYPTAVAKAIMSFPKLGEYQIVVTDNPQAIKVRVESEEKSQKLKEELEALLREFTLINVPVEFVDMGSLPRYEGKARRVVRE